MNRPTLPETGYVRLKEVLHFIPISKSKLYADIKAGCFPKPKKLGPRVSAWHVNDIRDHINSFIKQ